MLVDLPYEAIGELAVVLVGVIVISALTAAAVVIAYAAWYRTLTWLINLMWRGCHPVEGPTPTPRRRKIAIIAYGLRHFKRPTEIRKAIREGLDGEKVRQT